MKLISTDDYNLELETKKMDASYSEAGKEAEKFRLSLNHTKFVKQSLELGMFIPTDKEGNVLTEPKRYRDYLEYPDSFDGNKEEMECWEYQEAKERVLFKGRCRTEDDLDYFFLTHLNMIKYNGYTSTFEWRKDDIKHSLDTIEDLLIINDLTLTQSALKLINK